MYYFNMTTMTTVIKAKMNKELLHIALSTLYLTISGIVMPNLKSKGQF